MVAKIFATKHLLHILSCDAIHVGFTLTSMYVSLLEIKYLAKGIFVLFDKMGVLACLGEFISSYLIYVQLFKDLLFIVIVVFFISLLFKTNKSMKISSSKQARKELIMVCLFHLP
jgi:hypothetical protein